MSSLSWAANSIEPGQTVQMCRLAWLYTGGKGLLLLLPEGYELTEQWAVPKCKQAVPKCKQGRLVVG